jgi:hypothetical protein
MSAIEVTEFDHIVSFSKEANGFRSTVQFNRNDLFQRDDGLWCVKPDTAPMHLVHVPLETKKDPQVCDFIDKLLTVSAVSV